MEPVRQGSLALVKDSPGGGGNEITAPPGTLKRLPARYPMMIGYLLAIWAKYSIRPSRLKEISEARVIVGELRLKVFDGVFSGINLIFSLDGLNKVFPSQYRQMTKLSLPAFLASN